MNRYLVTKRWGVRLNLRMIFMSITFTILFYALGHTNIFRVILSDASGSIKALHSKIKRGGG